MKSRVLNILLLILAWGTISGQQRMGPLSMEDINPILPGYFADPTIKRFGDIYYIYATTDNEMLASGVPTVWYSKDFGHWYNYTMEVPSLESINLRNFWAPDIIEGDDGRYYLYFGNCQAGCNIYGYVSDTPVGPWEKLNKDDTPVIAHNYPRKGFPSLDAQFFKDDDGRIYAFWGTWVHYNGGYAVGELDSGNMSKVSNAKNIPLEETPKPFEAAYMMKKGGKYILMYSGGSCHDETYNVRYSYSDTPYGPFTPGANNPILGTNGEGTVHGPGHHSVLEEDGRYYIVYHKHDYPMTRGGLSRQVTMDEMVFENDSTIRKVVPGSKDLQHFVKSNAPKNLALGAKATASSFYHLQSLQYDYRYKPSFATDDHNATMWKAGNNSFPQHLTLNLGKVSPIQRVMTQFEFAGYYYQYKLEYSLDGKNWEVFADRSKNRIAGSPMIDDRDVKARYLKLTVLDVEKTGLYAAVWNIKVFGSLFEAPLDLQSKPSKEGPGAKSLNRKLVAIDANDLPIQHDLASLPNRGNIGGNFEKEGEVTVEEDAEGTRALNFTKGALVLDRPVPKSLEWNGSFTVATWVKNPQIAKEDECLVSWCDRFRFNLANSYNALHFNSGHYGAAAHLDGHFDMEYNNLPSADQWHHIVLTFDGVVENIYVDGKLDNSQVMALASQIDAAKIRIGASDVGENYSGHMASMQMYDYALTESEIKKLMEATRPSDGKK
ncbi:family 43 glycosylhydrolase [Flagellimonas halotolerans]|uniref:Family 43 glycosylhydrolase n=1 Tax=Flagellimonas halotolerans TaxID=3112164 RepID=A0ABU6IQB3_9FLAO|nr:MULTISPECIES: family 43 glycosylhydrolase [unclassified Allomuricauda]MEC3965316.1 family 43 glycosylhydrolase [Muricauda sp. SYSU M86414]MEC4265182.1 family 43 glycosylhydrolase [Muricauda sp. SYSU M84420]